MVLSCFIAVLLQFTVHKLPSLQCRWIQTHSWTEDSTCQTLSTLAWLIKIMIIRAGQKICLNMWLISQYSAWLDLIIVMLRYILNLVFSKCLILRYIY